MDPFIRERRVKTEEVKGQKAMDEIYAGLIALNGVERVAVRPPDRLRVAYDLMKVRLVDTDRTLSRLGHPLAHGLLHRMWRGWIGYTEQNMRDHLRTPPQPCCANPQLLEGSECRVCGRSTKRHRPR